MRALIKTLAGLIVCGGCVSGAVSAAPGGAAAGDAVSKTTIVHAGTLLAVPGRKPANPAESETRIRILIRYGLNQKELQNGLRRVIHATSDEMTSL